MARATRSLPLTVRLLFATTHPNKSPSQRPRLVCATCIVGEGVAILLSISGVHCITIEGRKGLDCAKTVLILFFLLLDITTLTSEVFISGFKSQYFRICM